MDDGSWSMVHRQPFIMSFDDTYFSTHTYADITFGKYTMYWWSNRFYAMLERRVGQRGRRLLEVGSGLGHLIGQLEDKVLEGLAPGMKVIRAGHQKLFDGAKVMPIPAGGMAGPRGMGGPGGRTGRPGGQIPGGAGPGGKEPKQGAKP